MKAILLAVGFVAAIVCSATRPLLAAESSTSQPASEAPSHPASPPSNAEVSRQAAPIDFLAEADSQFVGGNLELADHYALLSLSDPGHVDQAISALFKIRKARIEVATSAIETNDRHSIKRGYDDANALLAEVELQAGEILADDLRTSTLQPDSRAVLVATQLEARAIQKELLQKRRAGFRSWAWSHVTKAEQHLKNGKGRWYENDDEEQFRMGLRSLNRAWSVCGELGEADRVHLNQLGAKLKGELTTADYEGIMEQSRIELASSGQ